MAVLRISYFVMFFSALLWTKGESCSNGVYPESGFALVDHVFKSLHVDHLVSCYISCTAQPSCQSLNYNPEHPWRKLNSAAVCFGAKDDQFGQFQVEFGGSIEAVKLVHLSGQVSCDQHANVWSKWGCNGKHIFVFLTDASRTILLPMDQNSPYTIPGYDAQSSEIVFSGLPNPLHLRSGQELRMWYEEDLKNVFESDNGGKTCADVFVKYL
ncbi:PREDICTED: uncharacterized protein LOC107328208 isoform X2 [Acropora digitifera]|uniref:uncharacterized protein LOC107328208 isoform X2 n=1 Tax=Acropora digitifera TaxID=70779 RepID=UPI00077AAF3E|nr:PREDICTED: uncharacterized protein LOC107328208 isoform X2 [Acropora digitifera]